MMQLQAAAAAAAAAAARQQALLRWAGAATAVQHWLAATHKRSFATAPQQQQQHGLAVQGAVQGDGRTPAALCQAAGWGSGWPHLPNHRLHQLPGQPPTVHSACSSVARHTKQHNTCSSSLSMGLNRPYGSTSGGDGGSSSSSGGRGYILDYVHTQPCPSLLQAPQPPPPAAAPGAAAAVAPAAGGGTPAPDSPGSRPRGRVVAVAVSGGVDSAVSVLLLQQQGYSVFGVYMHNWDAADEAGAGTPTCTSEADLADARALCRALGIPLYEADFVARYWTDVFETFLQGLSRGLTPNPDLACNSHIKFGALLQFAREKGADLLATGHYARLGWTPAAPAAGSAAAAAAAGAGAAGWRPVLLAGADAGKDQTYFLAGLTHQQLAHAMFPVGHLTKARVRELAAAAGFSQATKRSSAGICFIGRRSFGRFLETYLQPRPGVYVDADSGQVLGPCSNMLAVTVGQKALGLGGQATRVYVVGKDLGRGLVHVAAGHDHPALYSSRVLLQSPNWVAGGPPEPLLLSDCVRAGDAAAEAAPQGQSMQGADAAAGGAGVVSSGVLRCQYQARYRQAAAECQVRVLTSEEAGAFKASRFCSSGSLAGHNGSGNAGLSAAHAVTAAGAVGLQQQEVQEGVAGQGQAGPGQYLIAELGVPLRGVAPGQMFVMYDGEVCLSSATIVAHGPTLAEGSAAALAGQQPL